MVNCKKCNSEVKSDWAYCPFCGKFIEIKDSIEIVTTTNFEPVKQVFIKKTQKNYYEKIAELKEESPNAYNPWTKEEEQQLTNLFNEGKKVKEIALILQRQQGGIKSRLKKIGLIQN
ncbi:MAG: hypothetical protein NTY48_04385 [Candidatus Diapherotrites archaeon]|nr:hypothetical protein [Candidatus Diapherotrites archaeon]